jgi:hypothetical protein
LKGDDNFSRTVTMTRYTARNGTTFLLDPLVGQSVKVAGASDDGLEMIVDLDDLREFLQYLEAGDDLQAPTDADYTAVSAD